MSTGEKKQKTRKTALSFFLVFFILEGLLLANMFFGVWSPAVADESQALPMILQNTAISVVGAVGAAIGAWINEAPPK